MHNREKKISFKLLLDVIIIIIIKYFVYTVESFHRS